MTDFWQDDPKVEKKGKKKLPLTWERFLKICFHLWRQFDDPYYAGFAAQIAYFFLMLLKKIKESWKEKMIK